MTNHTRSAIVSGQKVVCVNDDFGKGWEDWHHGLPVKGYVYTVRDVLPAWHFSNDALCPAIRLVEILHPIQSWFDYPGVDEVVFPARRFRPVVERKTDISVFVALLTPTRELEHDK